MMTDLRYTLDFAIRARVCVDLVSKIRICRAAWHTAKIEFRPKNELI